MTPDAPLLLPARCASGLHQHYAAILCDPPWQFNVWSRDTGLGRSAEAHYRTVSTDALCALPVADLAAPDCCLFLWATWPTLPDALRLGAAWGFEYKTLAFDWLKRSRQGTSWHVGLGFWTRANSEPCLLFTKGSPVRKSKGVRQLIVDVGQESLFPPIIDRITVHSAKPLEAYSRIMALVEGPYLEMFARNAYPGWDAWGNEAPNRIDWRPAWRVAVAA